MKEHLEQTASDKPPGIGLSPCASAVLRALDGLKNTRGECSPSLRDLVGLTGFSENSVRKALRRLERSSLLTCTSQFSADGGRDANSYTLRERHG